MVTTAALVSALVFCHMLLFYSLYVSLYLILVRPLEADATTILTSQMRNSSDRKQSNFPGSNIFYAVSCIFSKHPLDLASAAAT